MSATSLLALPALLRVRLGRFAAPVPPAALAEPGALARRLALVIPPLELDVVLLERLEAAPDGDDSGDAPAADAPVVRLWGVLEVAADTVVADEFAAALIGPAARLGSDRAVVLEVVARAGARGDALRYLQMAAPHEAGEVLASPSVARALAAAGGRIVGGPSPPVFAADGALLTRI